VALSAATRAHSVIELLEINRDKSSSSIIAKGDERTEKGHTWEERSQGEERLKNIDDCDSRAREGNACSIFLPPEIFKLFVKLHRLIAIQIRCYPIWIYRAYENSVIRASSFMMNIISVLPIIPVLCSYGRIKLFKARCLLLSIQLRCTSETINKDRDTMLLIRV
jgi:hypothetical protein